MMPILPTLSNNGLNTDGDLSLKTLKINMKDFVASPRTNRKR